MHHFLYYASHKCFIFCGDYFCCSAVLKAYEDHKVNYHDLFCLLDYIHYLYVYLHSLRRMVESQLDLFDDFLLEAYCFVQQLKEMLSTQSIYYIDGLGVVVG